MPKSISLLAALLALFALVGLAPYASAQTCTFKQGATRVTVPLNFVGSVTITNLLAIGTNGVAPDINGFNDVGDISLSAGGVPSTPVGLTFSITDPNSIPVPIVQGKTNTSGFKTNIWLTLNLNNVAEGIYTLSFNANGGATNNILFALQVGYLWNGGTNAILTGPGTWSDSTKWLNGAAPGVTDDVVFGDAGGQTNSLTGLNLLTNVVVAANTTVGSLRFSSTNTPTKFYNIQINDGLTLAATGSNGFSMIKDSLNVINGNGSGMTTTFAGSNGTLLVSNETANVMSFIDNGAASTLDLSTLGTFKTDVNRIGLGDYTLWPNYRNLNDQNAYGGVPRQALLTFNMARTNIIKAVFVDPYNYTNPDNRTYSLSWTKASELSGTSTAPNFNMGISNVFDLDSVLFGGANSKGNVQFNAAFAASNPICIFRGTNGVSRMSVFTAADGGATNTEHSNMTFNMNFGLGTLDLLVDRFYLARDRKLIDSPGGTPNYQGFLTMGKGTIDANNAILGYREYNQTNALSYSSLGYCQGRVTILSNGVFRVNNTLWLSYNANTNAGGEGSGGNTDFGQLNAFNNSTMIANTILVGGPSYLYGGNNNIVISNFSTLAVSNTLASANKALDSLTIAMNSTNQMQIDGNHAGPYYYVTNLVTVGSGNIIRIASIKNESFPVQVPLIQYQGGSHSGLSVVGPLGFTCNLVDNGAGSTIDVVITTNAPKNLLWRAYVNSTWDNSTANWLDLNTGAHTNFVNGDFVSFDDSPVGGASTISLDSGSSPIVSSGIGMTNTVLAYTIGGSGNISGSVLFTKTGTNSLDIEASTTAFIQLNQGSLTGLSGSIGGASTATGTTMYFLGTSSGGISCAGTGTMNNTINGSVAVLSGGIFTNMSSGNVNGLFSTAPNTLFVNAGTITTPLGTSIVASNSFFFNSGAVNADIITVNAGGTLEDTSGQSGGFLVTTLTLSPSITVAVSGTNVTYPGATFLPGGPGIGSTWVYNDSVLPFPGRLSLFSGSTTYINVDFANGQVNTKILAHFQDFGPSQSLRAFNGCTLVITNINPGAGSFAAGQVFNIFDRANLGGSADGIVPTGTATNSYPIIVPSAPGNGLAWDLSQLYPNGLIGVISVPTTGTNLTFGTTNIPSFVTITGYTTNNITSVITTNFATNNVLITSLSWPTNYVGWKLQQQAAALSVGLGTNWSTIVDASFTNYMTFTNIFTTNCVFYRMTYP